MFALFSSNSEDPAIPLTLHNTLSGKDEPFVPRRGKRVLMYSCGPTVYARQHIGNLMPYTFWDVLRRTLTYNGYEVTQVINITDVGHLTGENEGDADQGEDKMSAGLRAEGKELTIANMRALGEHYTALFLEDLGELNIGMPTALPRASDHIMDMIKLIETLEEKGYAYRTSDGVYFDTSRFAEYGKLGHIRTDTLKEGARVSPNKEKRHPADFALWKFNDTLGWISPWGKGFPGWHIECSAMAMRHLGKQIDIHTGGIDHIPVHHNNEIAQSESATGKPFARFWLHNAHLTIEGRKISKSTGNVIYLYQIRDRGFSPLSFRYWLLTAHYRTPVNFDWDALSSAHTALFRLHKKVVEEWGEPAGTPDPHYLNRFLSAINMDLDTPQAIALVWELAGDERLPASVKKATLREFDSVLGIGITEAITRQQSLISGKERRISVSEVPADIKKALSQRESARRNNDWKSADAIRDALRAQGYAIEDTPEGPVLRQISE